MNVIEGQDVIKKVEAEGWELIRTTGSHRHFKHPKKPGLVTISGNLYDEMPRARRTISLNKQD